MFIVSRTLSNCGAFLGGHTSNFGVLGTLILRMSIGRIVLAGNGLKYSRVACECLVPDLHLPLSFNAGVWISLASIK